MRAQHTMRAIALFFLSGWLSGCSGLFYYPSRSLIVPPSQVGAVAYDVFFPSANGAKLHGWLLPQQTGKPTRAIVVFYHGNAENLSSHYLNVLWLRNHPYDVLAFDYEGYGRSEGRPSPENTVADGAAALRWAHEKYPQLPIVVLAQSLGGAIALRNVIDLKKELPIRFVAVDSTFGSYQRMGRRALSRRWFTWPLQWLAWLTLSDRYAPEGEIAHISPIPLLVIHGESDRVVEFEMGERIFAEAGDPKEFWRVEKGGHTSVFLNLERQKLFTQKLARALERKL